MTINGLSVFWASVGGERDEVRIDFANPYLRHAAATVRLREAAGEEPSERVLPGTPDTAFRRQWLHFIDRVRGGRAPLTPLRGGLDDLRLAVDIMHALPSRSEMVA